MRILGSSSVPQEWTATSALLDTVYRVPAPRDSQAYVRRVLSLCESEGVTHVLPLTDVEIDAFALHHEAFSRRGITLCMSPVEGIRVSRDKWRVFDVFCNDPVIRTIPTWRLEELPLAGLVFPMIAKPRGGRSSEGLERIYDAHDLRHFLRKLDGLGYVVQPLLDGEVCVVDVVRQRSTGRSAAMARQELVRTSNGAGMTVKMLNDPVLIDRALEVARALDLNGCINIEFLVHAGVPLLMDINPRFSAGVAFSQLSGYDMVANHWRCFSGEALDDPVMPEPLIYVRRIVEIGPSIPES
ncbi:ATP-grasp domain-containing protein [Pseudomonas sp. SCB32]|uniref:ATP-grasp domain-containing protein n=1 Tax=Pseudomonas sp. SCB32 TaxID=2653853 RepID=UPI002114218D|nr:ATP-grasp domain-containing protein [Pseudomonas sp. SCB32]